jgi:hypothetical protein
MFPQMVNPNNGAVFANQDQGFLKWLFDFRREAVIPLRHTWRGEEFDFDRNKWIKSPHQVMIMNEEGISWCMSLIESYMNPAFLVTDMDEKTYNFRMREAVRVIYNNLCIRYKEFGMKKTDIHRVAEEIESKICAVLRGALNDGYRNFFSTQNQNIETKNLSQFNQNQKSSMWSRAAALFKNKERTLMDSSNEGY